MASDLTALQKQFYSKKVEAELFFKVSALSMANMVDMPHGITYHKPRIDFNGLTTYVKNTDIVVGDNNTEDETLVINTTPLVPFGIDEIELLEISYNLLDDLAVKAAQQIKENLDGDFFNEVLNATTSSAAPIKLTAGVSWNTVTTFSEAVASLVNDGVDITKTISVIDPFTKGIIGVAALWNTFKEADLAFRRGFRGMFQETMINVSTLLTATTDLDFGTIPTANDTVTINNVVFTFVASIGSAAGNVLIEASAALTLDNLVAAINGAAGAGSKYIEVSVDNRNRRLSGIVVTDDTTSMGLVSKRGYRVVSSSLTAAGDNWDQVVINNCIMEKGAISLAVQKGINLVTRDKPLQLGTNFFTWMRYGIKTFKEGRDRMYRLQIIAQDAEV